MTVELNERDGYWEIALKPSGGPNPMPVQFLQFDTLADVVGFADLLDLELSAP